MIRAIIYISAAILILILIVANILAEEIETDLLQYKNNRAYFAHGREVLVLPGNEFTGCINTDTVVTGTIDVSEFGVSYSRPIALNPDSISIDNIKWTIRAANVDSTTEIVLGAVYFDQAPYSMVFPDLFGHYPDSKHSDNFFTDAGNVIKIRKYISIAEMLLDFESGMIDGYFSYNYPDKYSRGIIVKSSPAPYYVALVPNMAALFNQRGLLTTSLYYWFGKKKLPAMFGGDNTTMQSCYSHNPDTCHRQYESDSEKGHRLLNVLKPLGRSISISAMIREFYPTVTFFADLLWREQVETRPKIGMANSDLYILPIPLINDSIAMSYRYIAEYLARDTVAGRSVNKTLQLLNNHINEIRNSDDIDRALEYSTKCNLLLQEDIGVFPLYRPTIFFIHRQNLGRADFNKNGFIDLTKITKVSSMKTR